MNLDDDDTVDQLPARSHQVIPAADREMLKLAGRALGAVHVEDVEGENWVNLHFADGTVAHGWNPLLFSGDTFELEVELNIEVRFHLAGVAPGVSATVADNSRLPVCRETWTPEAGNKPAAARRVATRAAAEIEKARAGT